MKTEREKYCAYSFRHSQVIVRNILLQNILFGPVHNKNQTGLIFCLLHFFLWMQVRPYFFDHTVEIYVCIFFIRYCRLAKSKQKLYDDQFLLKTKRKKHVCWVSYERREKNAMLFFLVDYGSDDCGMNKFCSESGIGSEKWWIQFGFDFCWRNIGVETMSADLARGKIL